MFPLLQPRNHNNNINNNHKISTYTDGYIQMDMSIPEKKVTKKTYCAVKHFVAFYLLGTK